MTEINSGVPQGSVLGPLLFLVYINDLTFIIKHCDIRLFADDACLFIQINDKQVAANLLNEDILAIEQWSKSWLVSFSAAKTESMIIGYKPFHDNHPSLYMHNSIIANVKQHKHVGLWLESNLWWHYHINEFFIKASKRLNILKFYKFKLRRNILERMYLVFVRPILEYADIVWAGAHTSDLMKLDQLQVEALRIVTGCTARSNIANLYKESNWEGLEKRRENHILKMIYRIVNNQAPSYLKNILPNKVGDVVPYPVRNSENIVTIKCRLNCFKRSFFPHGIELWNNLDTDIRNSVTLLSFSNALKNKTLYSNEQKERKILHPYGNRYTSFIHSRLRVGCSLLNNHLCLNLCVKDNPSCLCGSNNESVEHYFFVCNRYTNSRTELINSVTQICEVNLNVLLYGNLSLTLDQNKLIFEYVHKYIKDSKRFD